MKTLVALLCVLAFSGSLLAQPQPAPLPVAPVKPAPGTPATPATPATKPEVKKADPKADPKKKKEEEPKIDGIVINRSNGTFLGLKLENGTYKLTFYDAKKKPATPDVTRAAARWNPNYKLGSERMILNSGSDGKSLVGSKTVRPPYAFKLYLTLLKGAATGEGDNGEGEQAVESFVVDFRA
ncbi:MAG: hypothetical protein HYV95_09500 [Opitutae bacterium]|nr:hypothetical protein [Opitutae bacterium]